MATYLIVRNNDNDKRKTYICNTTHTGQPYIQIKDNCYLDLTTETSSGLQLKLQFKHRKQTHTDTVTTGYSGVVSSVRTTASGTRSTSYSGTTNGVYYTGTYSELQKVVYATPGSTWTTANVVYTASCSSTTTYTNTEGYYGTGTFPYANNITCSESYTMTTSTRIASPVNGGTKTTSYKSTYTTTDYSVFYNDFTPGHTATQYTIGYKTSSVPGQLSSTTALTKTQSSIHPGIYIPVQTYSDLTETTSLKENSYTVSTTLETSSSRESTYGYSGRKTYNITVTQTTGYSGRTSSKRTTASGWRSTTSSAKRTSTTGYSGRSTYKTTYSYGTMTGYPEKMTWSYSIKHRNGTVNITGTESYPLAVTSKSSTSTSSYTYSADEAQYQSFRTSTITNSTMTSTSFISTSWVTYSQVSETARLTSSTMGATKYTMYSSLANRTVKSSAVGALLSTTALTKTYTISQTSRYGTSNYSPYYADFTTSVTGTSMFTNYASSSAVGALLSTTALTNSQTKTSSSYASSTAAENLLTTTALTTSSQYSISTTAISSSFSYETVTFLTSITVDFE